MMVSLLTDLAWHNLVLRFRLDVKPRPRPRTRWTAVHVRLGLDDVIAQRYD